MAYSSKRIFANSGAVSSCSVGHTSVRMHLPLNRVADPDQVWKKLGSCFLCERVNPINWPGNHGKFVLVRFLKVQLKYVKYNCSLLSVISASSGPVAKMKHFCVEMRRHFCTQKIRRNKKKEYK